MMTNNPGWDRYKALKRWVGLVPDHGKELGLDVTIFGVCKLLSNRTVSDVETMLETMTEFMESNADQDDFAQFTLPPPGFNWELHGTGLWRLVNECFIDPRLTKLKVEKWELVASAALHSCKRAVDSLCDEPFGIVASLQVPSIKSQKLSVIAQSRFVFASLEGQAKFISTGKKTREASDKGNKSRHKSDQKQLRFQNILKEAEEIFKWNAKLTINGVAQLIEKKHPGEGSKKIETGYGRRTIIQVLSKKSRK